MADLTPEGQDSIYGRFGRFTKRGDAIEPGQLHPEQAANQGFMNEELEFLREERLRDEQRKARLTQRRSRNPILQTKLPGTAIYPYSTGTFPIGYRKLQKLADQIGRKTPLDFAITQMKFSLKRASKQVHHALMLARQDVVSKGIDPSRLVVYGAWVGKGDTYFRREIRARGMINVQSRYRSFIGFVLAEGPTFESEFQAKLAKQRRLVRSIGTGGIKRNNTPVINTFKHPGWQW